LAERFFIGKQGGSKLPLSKALRAYNRSTSDKGMSCKEMIFSWAVFHRKTRRQQAAALQSAPHLLQGRKGERVACRFLMRQGFDILARRYRGPSGELDIIALEQETLVFVEVKTRSSRAFGEPWEFVDWRKQQKLLRTAEEFIADHDLGQYSYRFDIVSVIGKDATLFRNAF
jgi:putative endonuclease